LPENAHAAGENFCTPQSILIPVRLPIWIASWEIACCQPAAIVGSEWTTYPFVNIGSLPWWADKAKQPIPTQVAELGTIVFDGTLNRRSNRSKRRNRTTITTGGITLPIRGIAADPPFTARLVVDAHADDIATALLITGIVEHVLGIRYERSDGYPVAQLPAIELQSANDQENGFDEYLVTLRIAGNSN
jgi:hypothetical protein